MDAARLTVEELALLRDTDACPWAKEDFLALLEWYRLEALSIVYKRTSEEYLRGGICDRGFGSIDFGDMFNCVSHSFSTR
jgi:hypothetical protein